MRRPRIPHTCHLHGSVCRLALINSLPVRSDDADFFAADASKLYSQSNEAIFLFLIIGSEGILVHDDNRSVMCAARPRKVWESLFDNSDEVGFLPRNFRLVLVQHGQCLTAFQFESRHPQSELIKLRGWRFHPLKRKGVSGCCPQFVLDMVSADLVKLPVQRRDSPGP
jgi:hypothetical protein